MGPAFVLSFFIAALVLFAQYLQKRQRNGGSTARKILHIGAISICAAAVYTIPDTTLLIWIVGAVVPALALVVQKGFFRDSRTGRRSWGIFYFALVYFILLLGFGQDRPELVYFPMLVLAWADGLATIIGERWGTHSYALSSDHRSIEGSVGFFLVALVVLLIGHFWMPAKIKMPFENIWVSIGVAAFLTLTEAISSQGRDNLWVPLVLVYWLLIGPDINQGGISFLASILVPAVASFFAFKGGWLQAGGAVSALLLGWVMLLSPEPRWIVPALVFFLIGSSLTKLPGAQKRPSYGNRSLVQVFSNGGFPVAALMVYFAFGQEAFLFGFACGFACALSDTASSEIGTRLKRPTFFLFGGRRVQPGLSGGISWVGIGVGAFFAAIMGLVFSIVLGHVDPVLVLVIALTGLIGNLLDSFFGAAFQVKYRPELAVEWMDEKPQKGRYHTKGYNWVSNDVVNMMSTGCATAIGIAAYFLV